MKLKLPYVAVACLAAAALCAPVSASAKSKKKAAPGASPSPSATASASPAAEASPSAEKEARAIPYHGTISAVDAGAKTFTITGKVKSRVFKITDKSVLTKAGAPATMQDVTVGELVRGSYLKQADGSMETKSVKLGPLTPAEQAAKDAHAAKRAAKKEKAAAASPSPKS